MNMIEQLSRALCWSNGMDPDITLGADGVNFLWMEYEEHAKAALEAMRSPTPDMIDAIDITLGGVTGVYHAMIDAALRDT